MTVLTNETWFPSVEEGLAPGDTLSLRREVFLKRRKEIQSTPGVWTRFHVFATRDDAVAFVRTVNRGGHPVFRGEKYEAEHLFNQVYLIYREG
jgi:hypothetical protein